MDARTKAQLEQAKAYCYEWRLPEAYGLFRRFFDRLPFHPEKEHADYIGLFVRILLELGKDYELKFYAAELERLYEKSPDPHLGYQLAMVHFHATDSRPKLAKKIFESIAAGDADELLKTKSKVMLILLHENAGELDVCRKLMNSISDPVTDPALSCIVRIWRSILARKENDYATAEAWIASVLQDCSFESNWYTYFSAKIEEARLASAQSQTGRVTSVLKELRRLLKKRKCRTLQYQIDDMQRGLNPRNSFGVLQLSAVDDENILTYRDKSIVLDERTALDKLTLLLLKKRSVTKESIVQKIYAREYDSSDDDRKIHYQIHALRKRLEAIGLPAQAIRCRGNGYKLLAEVEILGDDL